MDATRGRTLLPEATGSSGSRDFLLMLVLPLLPSLLLLVLPLLPSLSLSLLLTLLLTLLLSLSLTLLLPLLRFSAVGAGCGARLSRLGLISTS
jgi:hypothetical protein